MAVKSLSLGCFKEMDNLAVAQYNLPIELLMENAGLQLANLVVATASKNDTIKIGVGNGNNGGGGLVAARRLAAWGYSVYLDLAVKITKELPKQQLERALLFGAKTEKIENPAIWVDAYLGFSQKLPLSKEFLDRISLANASSAFKIALDIPIGISEDENQPMFAANQVLTLAAPKTILEKLLPTTAVYIADLGIPKTVYDKFNIAMPAFSENQLLRYKP
ncbi:NAD(P)H-hydrate epimerase [Cellulophaga sp. F20128]|uniref:NAD(P)H-hydrate epimerase n=1 Tax=Cellulophaga sp. F20128 TaxID=2926413 RepID=UPI001FF22141|nr:NAD(P)H-hydrate epimerase [Cellulophaga sp. F20128]MCK0158837.1 NAD(P)H-hydrate epimerase [Cellulophaga sp. F20128]